MKKLTATLLAPVVALILGGPASAAEPAAARPRRIDSNTATEEQIKATLGVGDEDAQRIVAARPYHKKDDLTAKHVVPDATFDKIQKLIDSIC